MVQKLATLTENWTGIFLDVQRWEIRTGPGLWRWHSWNVLNELSLGWTGSVYSPVTPHTPASRKLPAEFCDWCERSGEQSEQRSTPGESSPPRTPASWLVSEIPGLGDSQLRTQWVEVESAFKPLSFRSPYLFSCAVETTSVPAQCDWQRGWKRETRREENIWWPWEYLRRAASHCCSKWPEMSNFKRGNTGLGLGSSFLRFSIFYWPMFYFVVAAAVVLFLLL